jgi:YD repeat-containing protein
VTYQYDANNRLTTVRQNGNVFADQFTYDGAGTLARQTVADPNGTVLETRTFTWVRSEPLSPDPIVGQSGIWSDPAVYAALLQSTTITRGGQSWSTTHEYHTTTFNDFGQPWKITESGDFTRTTEITFETGFTPHIVGRPASTWTRVGPEGIGAEWEYDLSTGFVTSYVGPGTPLRRFVARSDGNFASEKDALNNDTTYENYTWAKPEIIRTPTTRTDFSINDSGTIASAAGAVTLTYQVSVRSSAVPGGSTVFSRLSAS